jgi:hypothetical protein
MNQIYLWCMENQLIVGAITGFIFMVIGAVLTKDKLLNFGFNLSQWIRKILGAKAEEKIEEIVHTIDEGMKSDNKPK